MTLSSKSKAQRRLLLQQQEAAMADAPISAAQEHALTAIVESSEEDDDDDSSSDDDSSEERTPARRAGSGSRFGMFRRNKPKTAVKEQDTTFSAEESSSEEESDDEDEEDSSSEEESDEESDDSDAEDSRDARKSKPKRSFWKSMIGRRNKKEDSSSSEEEEEGDEDSDGWSESESVDSNTEPTEAETNKRGTTKTAAKPRFGFFKRKAKTAESKTVVQEEEKEDDDDESPSESSSSSAEKDEKNVRGGAIIAGSAAVGAAALAYQRTSGDSDDEEDEEDQDSDTSQSNEKEAKEETAGSGKQPRKNKKKNFLSSLFGSRKARAVVKDSDDSGLDDSSDEEDSDGDADEDSDEENEEPVDSNLGIASQTSDEDRGGLLDKAAEQGTAGNDLSEESDEPDFFPDAESSGGEEPGREEQEKNILSHGQIAAGAGVAAAAVGVGVAAAVVAQNSQNIGTAESEELIPRDLEANVVDKQQEESDEKGYTGDVQCPRGGEEIGDIQEGVGGEPDDLSASIRTDSASASDNLVTSENSPAAETSSVDTSPDSMEVVATESEAINEPRSPDVESDTRSQKSENEVKDTGRVGVKSAVVAGAAVVGAGAVGLAMTQRRTSGHDAGHEEEVSDDHPIADRGTESSESTDDVSGRGDKDTKKKKRKFPRLKNIFRKKQQQKDSGEKTFECSEESDNAVDGPESSSGGDSATTGESSDPTLQAKGGFPTFDDSDNVLEIFEDDEKAFLDKSDDGLSPTLVGAGVVGAGVVGAAGVAGVILSSRETSSSQIIVEDRESPDMQESIDDGTSKVGNTAPVTVSTCSHGEDPNDAHDGSCAESVATKVAGEEQLDRSPEEKSGSRNISDLNSGDQEAPDLGTSESLVNEDAVGQNKCEGGPTYEEILEGNDISQTAEGSATKSDPVSREQVEASAVPEPKSTTGADPMTIAAGAAAAAAIGVATLGIAARTDDRDEPESEDIDTARGGLYQGTHAELLAGSDVASSDPVSVLSSVKQSDTQRLDPIALDDEIEVELSEFDVPQKQRAAPQSFVNSLEPFPEEDEAESSEEEGPKVPVGFAIAGSAVVGAGVAAACSRKEEEPVPKVNPGCNEDRAQLDCLLAGTKSIPTKSPDIGRSEHSQDVDDNASISTELEFIRSALLTSVTKSMKLSVSPNGKKLKTTTKTKIYSDGTQEILTRIEPLS